MTAQPELRIDTNTGEHDRFIHHVWSGGVGQWSEAYCGKVWIPERVTTTAEYPFCPTCKEVHREIESGSP